MRSLLEGMVYDDSVVYTVIDVNDSR